MSQITARTDFPSEVGRRYWLGERILDWSGIGVTHLRPTLFLENWLAFADTIRESQIFLPYGQGKCAPVWAEDVARVIVSVLVDPASHRGKTYVPTGPRSLTMSELAATFGRVLGKSIEYVDLPVAPWAQALAQFRTPFQIEYLASGGGSPARRPRCQTDIVRQIGGAPAKSPDAFVAEHRAASGG